MRFVTEIVRNCGKSFGFMTGINLNLRSLHASITCNVQKVWFTDQDLESEGLQYC